MRSRWISGWRWIAGLLVAWSAAAIVEAGVGGGPGRPPNIVLIISDDQAWTDYGFAGHAHIRTPNLDRLALESALFLRGYVPTALCRPSLMTLATGLYAHQHGVTGNDPSPALAPAGSEAYDALRARLIERIDRWPTVAGLLGSERGYWSHQSGKWWEGNYSRGGFTHGMTRGFPERGGRHGDDGLAIGREGLGPVMRFVDEAVSAEKPFFLWYAPFLPHTPHNPPARLLEPYLAAGLEESLARYYAMCEWFDETCGELIGGIEERGLRDNTLIVYVTDNGWIQRTPATEVPEGWRTSFAPRSKQSPYEGGIRTPILLSWPGVIPPGRRDEWVSSVDLVPTMLAAAGVRVPSNLPGVNLLPVVRGEARLERDALFGETFAHDVADLDDADASLLFRWVIRGRWKLLLSYGGRANRYAALHEGRDMRPQLFDLLEDPHETRNLASEYPGVVTELEGRIKRWAAGDW